MKTYRRLAENVSIQKFDGTIESAEAIIKWLDTNSIKIYTDTILLDYKRKIKYVSLHINDGTTVRANMYAVKREDKLGFYFIDEKEFHRKYESI